MNKKYMFYLSDKTRQQLEALAAIENRGLSGEMTALIQEEIKRRAGQFPNLAQVETTYPEKSE